MNTCPWILKFKRSQQVGPGLNEWTNQKTRNRHADPRLSQTVHDAGALAPVVFSGHVVLQSAKIHEIKRKEGPCPPKSVMANSMVMLVSAKNVYKSQFEAFPF